MLLLYKNVAPVTFLLWNPTLGGGWGGEEGANLRPVRTERMDRSDEEMGKERQRGRDGRTGGCCQCA